MSNKQCRAPSMYDPQMFERLGIDPTTGYPKGAVAADFKLKEDIRRMLRVKDEQDAVNRYVWDGIPLKLTTQEIERMLYYKQNLVFFYFEQLNQYFLMPYAMDEGLDFYGRPIYVHPVPYANGEGSKSQSEYLRTIKLRVIYDESDIEEHADENCCVIVRDYTPQFSENGIPRVQLQEAILDTMADCIPFSRTALLNSSGVVGIGVDSDTEAAAVYGFSNTVNNAALAGKKYLPIKKTMGSEFQELTGGTVARSQEFLQMLQGYNNFRLSMYGLDNNGLYEKSTYVNNKQSGNTNTSLSLQDGLEQRTRATDLINKKWSLSVSVSVGESVNNDQMDNADEFAESTSNFEGEESKQ